MHKKEELASDTSMDRITASFKQICLSETVVCCVHVLAQDVVQ